MQVVGLALGGRFQLPDGSVLVGLAETPEGPELKLEILLGRLPDVPQSFLDLLALGLSERPRELRALVRWLQAFTPEEGGSPGEISVLSSARHHERRRAWRSTSGPSSSRSGTAASGRTRRRSLRSQPHERGGPPTT